VIDEQTRSGLAITAFYKQRRILTFGFHRWKAILLARDSRTPT
jgi:hypothetical protein